MGQPTLLCCGTVCGGGDREGTMWLAHLLASFQSLPPLPTSKLGPSGVDSQVDGLMYILVPCGSLQQTLWWGWEFIPLRQPPQVFTARGFEALFPRPGTLGYMVCLASRVFLRVYPHANVGPHGLPATTLPTPILQLPPCHRSSLPQLSIFAPPTSLNKCFFFNSLVVSLLYSSIFWQFWLFFVFKFVVVFLLVVWGGKVNPPMPLSWLEVSKNAFKTLPSYC